MSDVKDSALGKNQMRMRYIKVRTSEIQNKVIELVKIVFETRANNCSESLKVGNIVFLHKNGDRNDCNNYRVGCLPAMASGILAQVATEKLKTWTEQCRLLKDMQNVFRPSRSSGDAMQMTKRIQENAEDPRVKRETENIH